MNRMRAAEEEKDALEQPRKEAEEYVKTEALHLEQRARIAQIERYKGVKTCDTAKADMEAAQGRLEELRAQYKDQEKELRKLEKELGGENGELLKVREEMEKARKDFEKCEQEDLKLTEQRKFAEQNLKKL